MRSPDLTAAPFHLDTEAIAWVRDTVAGMTEDEQVGQLFINDPGARGVQHRGRG